MFKNKVFVAIFSILLVLVMGVTGLVSYRLFPSFEKGVNRLFKIENVVDNNESSNLVDSNVSVSIPEYVVTYDVKGDKTTKSFKEGELLTFIDAPEIDGYVFKGWTINKRDFVEEDVFVTENISVSAVYYKLYTVVFKVDDLVYETIVCEQGQYITIDDPVKDGYVFNGWCDELNDGLIVDLSSLQIRSDYTFVANFSLIDFYACEMFVSNASGELTHFNPVAKQVWTDGQKTYYSNGTEHYVFDSVDCIWYPQTWNGKNNFYGEAIWSDGVDVYYSMNTVQRILDKETQTWVDVTWNGLTSFNFTHIWSDGENYFCSNGSDNYILDTSSRTWSTISFNYNVIGQYVWTDGENTFFSNGSDNYVFDKLTKSWSVKSWTGLLDGLDGRYVWTDGQNIYDSLYNMKLDKETSSWSSCSWSISLYNASPSIWTDGENIYCSLSSKSLPYILAI